MGALFSAPYATAQSSTNFGWEIESFHSDYVLTNTNGSLSVREEINVRFDTPKHGIFRDIPTAYQPGIFSPDVNLNVEVLSVTDAIGANWPYEQSSENGFLRLRIGDPNQKIDGQHQYNISYSLENAVRFYDTHDELFWDVNGTDWNVPMDSVSASFRIDEPLKAAITDTRCITGLFGLSGTDCSINLDEQSDSYRVNSTRPLSPYENVSVVFAFEKGVFEEPGYWEQYGGVIMRHAGIVLLTIPVFIGMFLYWRKRGKDLPTMGVVVTQFDPPNHLTPAEVGTLSDYTADNKDITATVIDLAIRGVVRIIDTTKKDDARKRQYTFELLTDDISQLRPHEKMLIEGMFKEITVGQKVALKDLKNSFYETVGKVKKHLYSELTEHRYFAANPNTARIGYLVAGAIISVLGAFSAAATEGRYLGWSVGFVFSGMIIAFFGLLMPKRTRRGVTALEHTNGLKQYLEVAEEDRLAMMQSADSRYIGDTTAPEFTVELYEKLLPFALVLGVEKSWSEKFSDIYTQPPDWYQGNWTTFNSALLASRLSSGMGTMNSTFTSRPSSSSSSGFSSGGFSGGGFGGGGGGSW